MTALPPEDDPEELLFLVLSFLLLFASVGLAHALSVSLPDLINP